MNVKKILVMVVMLTQISVAYAAEQKLDQVKDIKPKDTYLNQVVDQMGRGLGNMVYAPVEILYQLKNEITDVDPIRGLVPGLIKGLCWGVAREGVGIFELVTSYAPAGPYIKGFDTDWLFA